MRTWLRGVSGVVAGGAMVVVGATACGSSSAPPANQAVGAVSTPAASPTVAALPTRKTAVVTIGDSYISGEGGRWNGNTDHLPGDRLGTDRAYDPKDGKYHPEKVYGASYKNGCNRSDVSEVVSSNIPVDAHINIACSGAETANIMRSKNGGEDFKGEPPQDDQLYALAHAYDIKAVVLSIGGNDLGFASIISDCATQYITMGSTCKGDKQRSFDKLLPKVQFNVGNVIEDVKATMSEAGYAKGSYKLSFQSYPIAIPTGDDNRYPQWDRFTRVVLGGCPMYDSDSTWAHDALGKAISDNWREIAKKHGVQFLNLYGALDGHEICAKTDGHSTGKPNPKNSEWFRFIVPYGITQGDQQESMHPNAYGQQVLGECLRQAYGQKAQALVCNSTLGKFVDGVKVTQEK